MTLTKLTLLTGNFQSIYYLNIPGSPGHTLDIDTFPISLGSVVRKVYSDIHQIVNFLTLT